MKNDAKCYKFIFLAESKLKCEQAQFGLIPHLATDKNKFGLRSYNTRSETVSEKLSYRSAWKDRRFDLAIINRLYKL